MDIDDATTVATRLLRRRPTEILPPFLGDAATGVVAQTVGLVTLAVALFSLRGTGRIDRLVEAVTELTESEGATDAEIRAVQDAVGGLLTPTVTATLVVGAVVAVVAVGIFRATVGAAKLNAAMVAVREARAGPGAATESDRAVGTGSEPSVETDGGAALGPLTAAVEGVFADTWRLAGLTALRAAVLLGPFLVAAVVGPLALLLILPALLFAYVGFLFAAEAVVVDGAGPVGGLRRNVTVFRRETAGAVVYVLLEIGAYAGVLVASGLLALAGVGRIANVAMLFLLLPWLSLVRMGLYLSSETVTTTGGPETVEAAGGDATDPARRGDGDETGAGVDAGQVATRAQEGAVTVDDRTTRAGASVGGLRAAVVDLRDGVRRGVVELRRFLATHPGLFAVSLLTFVVGAGIGRLLGPSAPEPVTGDPTTVFGNFPLGTAINLTANNWLVAIGGGFAGVALGVPTIANLLFNGLLVGTVSGLVDSVAFAALVLPHAVVEVPALAVGGALGLQFGREGYRVAVGRSTAAEFAEELRRGLLVLIGLLPVFLIAGLVEAFVTPLVAGIVVG